MAETPTAARYFDDYYTVIRLCSEQQLSGVKYSNAQSLRQAKEYAERAKQLASSKIESALAIAICASVEQVTNVCE